MEKEQIFIDMDNLVEIMKSNDRYIYHYTSAEIAREFILANGTLKFSKSHSLNDPEESTKYENLNFNNKGNLDNLGELDELMNFRIAFPSLVHSLSFCTDNDDCEISKNKNYSASTNLHINKGFMLSRMWGTYGNKHEGVCLCFDKHKLLESLNLSKPDDFSIHSKKVTYSTTALEFVNTIKGEITNSSPLLVETDRKTFSGFRDYIKSKENFFFFWKQNDWRDENEYKVVLVNNTESEENDIYLSFGDSLQAIFMGERFSLGEENDYFKEYCVENKISAFRTMFKGGNYQAIPFNFNYIK